MRGFLAVVVVCTLLHTSRSYAAMCPVSAPCQCKTVNEKWVASCRRQSLTSLPKFSGNPSVYILDLGNNPITDLPKKGFLGIKPTKIYLDRMDIVSMDKDAFLGVEDVLESLDMQYNKPEKLMEIPEAVKRLKNLKELKISVYGTDLPADSFRGLSKLERLTIIGQKITSVDDKIFNGIEGTLKYLEFKVKRMPKIYPAISTLKNLEELVLNKNKIAYLTEISFRGMDRLIRLSLYWNTLMNIHKDTFKDAGKSLEYLGLSICDIQEIPVDSFKYLPKLKQLEMFGNLITTVPNGAFKHLDSLKKLSIGQKFGLTLTAKSFDGIGDTLETLSISDSKLETIPTDAFESLKQLQVLDLNGNQIETVPEQAFKGLTALVSVNLESNKIATVDRNAFAGMGLSFHHHLGPVLHSNKIRHVTFLQQPCVFTSVQILDNPLDCDCGLLNVTRLKGGPYIAGHCLTPPTFSGVMLSKAGIGERYTNTCHTTEVWQCPINAPNLATSLGGHVRSMVIAVFMICMYIL